MLQDVLGVPLIFGKLGSYAQDLAALPHVKLQVVVCACAPLDARHADIRAAGRERSGDEGQRVR